MRSYCVLGCLLAFLAPCFQTASAQTPPLKFEVASVKSASPDADPNAGSWSFPGIGRFTATHVSLEVLLKLAYGVDKTQIVNMPGWMEADLYDVSAKPENGISLTREELKPCLQDLLRQRFHLEAHTETRRTRGYALVAAKEGPHLTPTTAERFPGYRIHVGSGEMRGENWSMAQLATYLASVAGFPVVDQTGITGSYDVGFSYNPKPESESNLPTLEVALKEATGLLLKSEAVPVAVLVIDSADRVPVSN